MSTGSGKDAFGPGNGLSHEFGLAMDKVGATPLMFKLVVSDPFRRESVGATIRGELSLPTISSDQWIEREIAVRDRLVSYGMPPFEDSLLQKAATMGVGINDRFVPGGLSRRQLLEIAGEASVKLNGGTAKSADYEGEELVTKPHIFSLDHNTIFRPYGEHMESISPPFMLNYDQQWQCATTVGGDGFTTAETAIYVAVIRPWVEFGGRFPYMGGSIRCRNAHGLGYSLSVGFYAFSGLLVSYGNRSRQYWHIWALPEVSRELVP